MARQSAASLRAAAVDDIEHALGQAGFHRQFGQAQGGVGRQLGGLEHHGVACGQRGPAFPGGHGQWEVPGGDGRDHAIGLGHDHAQAVLPGGGDVAADLVGQLGEEADGFGGKRDITVHGFADGAGRGRGLQLPEFDRVPVDEVGPPVEHTRALAWRAVAPAAGRPGPPGVLHGEIHRALVGQGDAAQRLPVAGSQHLQRFGRADMASADVMPFGSRQVRGLEIQRRAHCGSAAWRFRDRVAYLSASAVKICCICLGSSAYSPACTASKTLRLR